MDLNTIANFAVAGGTLALAYYSFKNIKNSDKQLKFLKEQIHLNLSQQQPDIQITNYSFNGNKLNLELKNQGKGTAYDIAVLCEFHIIKPLWWSKNRLIIPKITEQRTSEEIEKIRGNRNSIFNILFKLKDKNILEPDKLVVFPSNDIFFNSLHPSFGVTTFQCEPLFHLKIKEEQFDIPPYIAKAIPFDELKTLLLNSGIKEISVIFHLLSKDNLQNVLFHGEICDFVLLLIDDGSLEDGYKRGKRGPYPLDKKDIKTRHKWLDYPSYRYVDFSFEKDE